MKNHKRNAEFNALIEAARIMSEKAVSSITLHEEAMRNAIERAYALGHTDGERVGWEAHERYWGDRYDESTVEMGAEIDAFVKQVMQIASELNKVAYEHRGPGLAPRAAPQQAGAKQRG